MHNRKVVLCGFEEEEFDYGNRRKAVDDAVGYLSMWSYGSERYLDVWIYANAKTKVIDAVYKNGMGERTYYIGAVEGEDGTYSTHS